jgi:putative flippase GtrA
VGEVFSIVNEIYTEFRRLKANFASRMRRVHNQVRATIFKVLDIFYPLFRPFMPLQTYHYAACGGVNTALSLLTYFIAYNFVFKKEIFQVAFLAFQPHIAALILAFAVSFPVGFYLSMYVIFQGSYLKKRVQLFRYFIVILGCMVINYIFLKIFVETFGWYPTPSQLVTTGIVILFNYFTQRHFSFKSEKNASLKQGIRV